MRQQFHEIFFPDPETKWKKYGRKTVDNTKWREYSSQFGHSMGFTVVVVFAAAVVDVSAFDALPLLPPL